MTELNITDEHFAEMAESSCHGGVMHSLKRSYAEDVMCNLSYVSVSRFFVCYKKICIENGKWYRNIVAALILLRQVPFIRKTYQIHYKRELFRLFSGSRIEVKET